MGRLTQITLWCCGVASLLGYLWLLYWVITSAPLNPDVGCYLSIVRDIAEGAVPYRDIKVHYTPLGIYLLYWFGGLLSRGVPTYEVYLCSVIFFEILSSIATFLILRVLGIPRLHCFLAAVFLGYYFLSYQGGYIEVEAYAVFFALCALYVVLRWPEDARAYLGAGIFASLSFLSKQYGMGAIAAPLAACFLCHRESRLRLKFMFLVCLGWIVPLGFVVCYFVLWQHTPLTQFLDNLRRQDLAFVFNELGNVKRWLLEWAIGLLLVGYAFTQHAIRTNRMFLVLVVGSLAFLPQFLVRQSLHYFLFPIPFVVILVLYSWKLLQTRRSRIVSQSAGFFLFLMGVLLAVSAVQEVRSYADGEMRRMQYAKAQELRSMLVPGQRVLLIADPVYLYLSDIRPFAPILFSYDDYPGLHSVPVIRRMLELAKTAIVDRSDKLFYSSVSKAFQRQGESLDSALSEMGFTENTGLPKSDFEMWERKEQE